MLHRYVLTIALFFFLKPRTVSPLMENKCGDRMAMPSVYGRADDAMGNSVPGFGIGTASATTLRDELNAQSYFRDSY